MNKIIFWILIAIGTYLLLSTLLYLAVYTFDTLDKKNSQRTEKK
jgi:hypothetical protein